MSSKKSYNPYKRYCCVYGCLNKRKNNDSELSFFKIPEDVERRREWLTVIDRKDLLDEEKLNKAKNNFVCCAHFDESAIITSTSKRLKSDAIPTKLLPQESHKNKQPESCSIKTENDQALPQTPKDLASHLSKKDNILVSTSHTQAQKRTLPYKIETGFEITKPNLDESLNELKHKPTVPSVPTTTLQYQTQFRILSGKRYISTKTQTDLNEPENKITQTHSVTVALSDQSPRTKKLKKELAIAKRKRRRLELKVFKIEKELEAKNISLVANPEDEAAQRFMKLFEWQNQIKTKFKGNRYNAEYKIFALNLFYANPHAYSCLQTVLKLPSKSTLNRLKLKIPPKLDDGVLNSIHLKLKSLPDNAKYCTISIDKVALKRNLCYDIKKDELIGFHNINGIISPETASNAYVIMVQGIYCNWKQPITYAFLGSTKHHTEIDSWINEVILKLFRVGIEVKAIISDQGSYFDKYAKETKNVTVDKPFFFVEEHKIHYIFDVPHLLKCVRNSLLSSDLHFENDRISWDHIKTLYEHQKDKNLRLIPKITRAHVEPNNLQRMKLKYAAQIFSNTVSAALDTYIDFGAIAEEARGTSKFIKIMDDLFDILNSSKIKSDKKYQCAFKMSTEQKLILQNAQHMFSTIKSANHNTCNVNTNEVKTFHNFQITIQSVLQLFEDLQSEGLKFLFTRRLNQDSLKTFFGSIRLQGSCSEPTPIQFTRAFSKCFYINMLKKRDQYNCETDIYEMLTKAENIINKESLSPSSEQVKPSLVALSGKIDYHVDLPVENALTYVAAFLIFQCYQKHHNCKEMSEMLESSLNLDLTKFTHYKAYNKSKPFYGSLKMPSQEMNKYVQKLESVFSNNFEYHVHGNPGSEIFKLLKGIELPTLPCSCFPVDDLLKLFVRLRIFSTLKFNNQHFKSGRIKNQQYLKIKQL